MCDSTAPASGLLQLAGVKVGPIAVVPSTETAMAVWMMENSLGPGIVHLGEWHTGHVCSGMRPHPSPHAGVVACTGLQMLGGTPASRPHCVHANSEGLRVSTENIDLPYLAIVLLKSRIPSKRAPN